MKRLFGFLLLFSMLFTNFATAGSGDNFTLTTIDGKQIEFEGTPEGLKVKGAEGKVVFLEFWGTRCPPCKMSIPHYINLTKKYKDKLKMIAIEVQEMNPDVVKSFVKERGINYDVITYNVARNFVNYISRRSGWQGAIPFLIILDGKGNVVTMQAGLLQESALANLIDELTKRASTSTDKNSTK